MAAHAARKEVSPPAAVPQLTSFGAFVKTAEECTQGHLMALGTGGLLEQVTAKVGLGPGGFVDRTLETDVVADDESIVHVGVGLRSLPMLSTSTFASTDYPAPVYWHNNREVAKSATGRSLAGLFLRLDDTRPTTHAICWLGPEAWAIARAMHPEDLTLEAPTELTISVPGAVTVTQSVHTIDTNADAASDNLDSIAGMTANQLYLFKPSSAARTVVLRDATVGSGNIRTPGAQSVTLAEAQDWVLCVSDGTDVSIIAGRTLAVDGFGPGSSIGDLTTLKTVATSNLVASINELVTRFGAPVADATALAAVAAADRADAQTRIKLDDSTLWTFDTGSAAGASAWVIAPGAGTGRWLRQQPSLLDLAAITTGNGAALIGIEDAALRIAAATVEAALAELAGRITIPVADAAAMQAIVAGTRVNGMLLVKLDDDTVWTFDSSSASGSDAWHIVPSAGTGEWVRRVPSLLDLSTAGSATLGAILVGIRDAVGGITGTTVEAALAELAGRIGIPAANDAALQALTTSRTNGQVYLKLDTGTLWTYLAANADGADAWTIVPTDVTGRFKRYSPSLLDLSTPGSATLGAILVGIRDVGNFTTQTTVEGAFAEIYQDLESTLASVPLPLFGWRIVGATSDVGNVVAIGGVTASNTDPILRADANESQELYWAAGSVVSVAQQTPVPADLDDTKDVLVELDVYTDNTSADAATFTIKTSWNGGAKVDDTATDGAHSATVHTITGTIATADVPASSRRVSITLTPAAHATDGVLLVNASLRYTRKLRTS